MRPSTNWATVIRGWSPRWRCRRRTTTWTALEMMPNRRLGVLNAERKLGLPPSSDFDQAVARTWLGQLPEPWTVQLHIAYDLTHTVFHLTNWGEAPSASRLPSPTT